jgi:hypothetical protein
MILGFHLAARNLDVVAAAQSVWFNRYRLQSRAGVNAANSCIDSFVVMDSVVRPIAAISLNSP